MGTEHEAEFRLLEIIERLAPQPIADTGKSKDICANVDLYSGCVYSTLGILGIAHADVCKRSHGWLERTVSNGAAAPFRGNCLGKRIMRPAFKKTGHARESMSTSPIENSPVLLNCGTNLRL